MRRVGPLAGVKVVEIAGIGPGPFCAMMLADMGADIIRIERAGAPMAGNPRDFLNRGRRSVAVNLKTPEGVETVLRLCEQADAILEGFRPGVMERLGLGPDDVLARNAKVVYGRMTGWGQDGPLAQAAGHDMNYISINGVLHSFGHADGPPQPPCNAVGDFGGGGMLLAFGVVCGILEAQRSGTGQVIDAAMVDGSAVLMTMVYAMRSMGFWFDERGTNLLDTGAHFYEVYETKDGKYVSVGSIEPQFYAEMLSRLGIDPAEMPGQMDRSQWHVGKEKIAAAVRTKTRDEWAALVEGTDACMAPVLSIPEALEHPHIKARGTFVEFNGQVQPAPAPRFSRTEPEISRPAPSLGEHTDEALGDWGFSTAEVAELRACGAVT
ncbi:MAG: CoA transferase [Acidimicrobiia bacterium]|nr:CoA transferase [Acidimicrobiia bacterium]